MSADVTETETFDLSPEQVFDYVVDFSNLAEWDPMFDESRAVDGGEVGLGSTFLVTAEVAGQTIDITYRIEEYDRPNHARLVGEAEKFTSIDRMDIEPHEGGAKLTWSATVDADADVIDTLATPLFKMVAKASMSGLRDKLGSQ